MGSGASKLKYIVENSSADHVVAALKEQLSQEDVDEFDLEGCSSRLIQRIEDLQEEQDCGGDQDSEDEENPVAAAIKSMFEDSDDEQDSDPPKGFEGPSQDETQTPHATTGASAPRSPTSPAEYSLEDPRDLAKFLRTADICFVRAEYFWQLFDQNKVPPARRQELEEDNENKIKTGKTFAEPLVSHDEVDEWASGEEEALLCSISHCWESREHADFTGDQTRKIASATAMYHAAYGLPVWVFIDFLSIYQYKQTDEQREKFDLAMQNMHLLYSHESTITLRVENLTSEERIKKLMEDPESKVKIFYKPSEEEGQVKTVHISKLTLNPREYFVRGWCRAEIQWSCQRSDVRSNQQIDSWQTPGEEERTFNCQVAEEPKQFELHAKNAEMQFTSRADTGPVLALQKKVFFQKAEKCEHLVVEYVDSDQIAVLALSIKHYKVLKSLTLRNFHCRLPEAEQLCKALAKKQNLQELEKVMILKPADPETQKVIEDAFRSCKVNKQKPKLRLETEVEGFVSEVESEGWRAARCLPEPKIPHIAELLQSGKAFNGQWLRSRGRSGWHKMFGQRLDLSDLSEYEQRAVLRVLKWSMTVRWVVLQLRQIQGVEELQDLRTSKTSVCVVEFVGQSPLKGEYQLMDSTYLQKKLESG